MKAKLMIMGVVAAVAVGAMAEITNTVKVTKFHQSYPYSGKITINTDDASATFTQRNIVAGANSHVIDFASSFGGALLLTNASFVVTIGLGGVQLWEGGPYWAECNVGASKPEEYGYYFWWGDTVGYKRENNKWVATDGSSANFSFSRSNTPTYDMSIATLKNGELGAIVCDTLLAKNLCAVNPGLKCFELAYADGSSTIEEYGIAMKKGDEAFVAKVDELLKTIIDDGTVDKWILEHTDKAAEIE